MSLIADHVESKVWRVPRFCMKKTTDLVEIYSVSAETIISDAFSYSKEVKKNVKNMFLSMCHLKVFLTFTSLNMVLYSLFFYCMYEGFVHQSDN